MVRRPPGDPAHGADVRGGGQPGAVAAHRAEEGGGPLGAYSVLRRRRRVPTSPLPAHGHGALRRVPQPDQPGPEGGIS
eukprot:3538145-Pyramimonas_sp.AAC.1